MKSILLIFVLIGTAFSVIPVWDFSTSVQDLLTNYQKDKEYTIDYREGWYDASDKLEKYIKKESNGAITQKNSFKMIKSGNTLFNGKVDFESIESFYGHSDARMLIN